MDGIEKFSESKNLARVASGFKGGPWYNKPVTVPERTIVEGVQPTVLEKLSADMIKQGTPVDPWVYRK